MILNTVANRRPKPGNRLRVARLDGVGEIDLTDLWDRAGAVAGELRARGVRRGGRIGVLAANGLEWVLADLAALRLGAVVAGLEPGKFDTGDDLRARYDLAFLFSDRVPAGASARCLPTSAIADWSAGEPACLPPVEWHPADPVALKFTSGSSGTPKCLTASAGSVDSSLRAVQQMFMHGPGDDLFVFLPLSLLQQRYWVYSALAFGHDVTISTPAAAFVHMRTVQPTVVMGVPAFFDAARRHIERSDDLVAAARELFGSRVRYLWTGSAPANPATLDFLAACGLRSYEGYGLNETCIVTKNAPGGTRRGSVGRALPGKQLFLDTDGVVCVRSDHPVAARYEVAPPGTNERMFRGDGVVWTGDLGRLDADGYLYLTGRADDAIVLGNGRKVLVRPIEDFVKASLAVAECVVFCPDDTNLVAVVSPADNPADVATIHSRIAIANAAHRPDEQIARVVVARDPFSTANGQLTSQGKPRRHQIQLAHHDELSLIREDTPYV